jgi:hypothetical protein
MTRPAASRSLIRAHTLMGSEPLLTREGTGEARAGLAALDVPELRAHARKTLPNGSMPAVIMVFDEISVTEMGTVKAVAPPVPELSGLLPYKAPAAGSTDRRSDHLADARK